MKRAKERMNPPMPKETQISDLQLAAYLLASGHSLTRAEGTGNRLLFIFADVPEDMVFRYYRGEDSISARALFGAYRDLKGLTLQRL